jgi:rhodanese-related sulfurtransferase
LRGSVNVGLGGRFAEYAGEVMQPGTPIVLIVPPGHESEAKVRLARIGFDNVVGVLHDSTRAFVENPQHVVLASRLSAAMLSERIATIKDLVLIDVRNPGEFALGSIPGAQHISLPELIHRIADLDPTKPTVVFCAGGYRSSIARSLLRSHGINDVSDLVGGFTAWAAHVHPQVDTTALPAIPAIDVNTVAANPDAFIVDIREYQEWAAGHVATAIHIPMGEIISRIDELPIDRQIVCMCRSGNRSARVTSYLVRNGFDVVNLSGGAQRWLSHGHPLVSQFGHEGVVI